MFQILFKWYNLLFEKQWSLLFEYNGQTNNQLLPTPLHMVLLIKLYVFLYFMTQLVEISYVGGTQSKNLQKRNVKVPPLPKPTKLKESGKIFGLLRAQFQDSKDSWFSYFQWDFEECW